MESKHLCTDCTPQAALMQLSNSQSNQSEWIYLIQLSRQKKNVPELLQFAGQGNPDINIKLVDYHCVNAFINWDIAIDHSQAEPYEMME